MNKEEIKQTMASIGRDKASRLLRSAIESAKNPDQLSNQLFACRVSAIHILATEAFNLNKQKGKDLKEYMKELVADIEGEIDFLNDEEMEYTPHSNQDLGVE